jgi:hypothetical protein
VQVDGGVASAIREDEQPLDPFIVEHDREIIAQIWTYSRV